MSELFNKYYRRYDAWYNKNRVVYLSELKAVRKVMPLAGNGLEIGVGSGRFAAPLGIKTGVDTSEKMIDLARKRGVDAREGNGEELPFPEVVFDYVVIIVTLCFVRDPEKVIYESARVLKPNGKIIVGIIDKDSFFGKAYREKENVFYDHARFFSVEEITRMLKAGGFKRFLYYQTVFAYPFMTDAVEEPLEGYGKGGFVVIGAEKPYMINRRR